MAVMMLMDFLTNLLSRDFHFEIPRRSGLYARFPAFTSLWRYWSHPANRTRKAKCLVTVRQAEIDKPCGPQ
jgi:hypothetical protein